MKDLYEMDIRFRYEDINHPDIVFHISKYFDSAESMMQAYKEDVRFLIEKCGYADESYKLNIGTTWLYNHSDWDDWEKIIPAINEYFIPQELSGLYAVDTMVGKTIDISLRKIENGVSIYY